MKRTLLYCCLLFICFTSVTAKERHLFLMIGQSNMAGRATIEKQDTAPIEGVFLWDIGKKKWIKATPPYNQFSPAAKAPKMQRLNIGPTFAKQYLKDHPEVEIGFICAARGGTSLGQWTPDSTDQYHLYRNAIDATKQALDTGGELKGILWHQGEANKSAKKVSYYLKTLSRVVEQMRAELETPKVPFICGQISQLREENAAFNTNLLKVAEQLSNAACVSSKGLTASDGTHFDSKSMRELGIRYATALNKLTAGESSK